MEPLQQIIPTLPHSPGVYIFRSKEGEVLYVGKAKDLKHRVSQYAQRPDAIGTKTPLLVNQIAAVTTQVTLSEFDALLLEAKLIHHYQPKYNAIAKDDKSPLYVAFTLGETLPRVLFVRQNARVVPKGTRMYGPFQSAYAIRQLLRQIRGVIPYCTQKKRDGRPCFYTHIHQCSPCPSVIAAKPAGEEKQQLIHEYRRNIIRLSNLFSGKSVTLLHELESEMAALARQERFEEARAKKNRVDRLKMLLEHHYDPAVYLERTASVETLAHNELGELKSALAPYYADVKTPARIECIDISNTSGEYATGSLVVLCDGAPCKSEYRRFKIRTKDSPNDYAMIAEVLGRRLAHKEWPYPDLLVIDGGKGQVQAAKRVLDSVAASIPLIGLAKRFEEIIIPRKSGWHVVRLPYESKGLHVLQRVRDESHRFALTYHRLLRKKGFMNDAV